MKFKMTVEEALELADMWSQGLTLSEGSEGWRVVCIILAEEVRRVSDELICKKGQQDAQHMQARIDALMLEFCPDQMTPEQIVEWKRHQTPHCTALSSELPASHHTAKECSEAFEWRRSEALKDGASKHAGVALDEWQAAIVHLMPQQPEVWKQDEIKNQCDGCRTKAPLSEGFHISKHGKAFMICQKSRYET